MGVETRLKLLVYMWLRRLLLTNYIVMCEHLELFGIQVVEVFLADKVVAPNKFFVPISVTTGANR